MLGGGGGPSPAPVKGRWRVLLLPLPAGLSPRVCGDAAEGTDWGMGVSAAGVNKRVWGVCRTRSRHSVLGGGGGGGGWSGRGSAAPPGGVRAASRRGGGEPPIVGGGASAGWTTPTGGAGCTSGLRWAGLNHSGGGGGGLSRRQRPGAGPPAPAGPSRSRRPRPCRDSARCNAPTGCTASPGPPPSPTRRLPGSLDGRGKRGGRPPRCPLPGHRRAQASPHPPCVAESPGNPLPRRAGGQQRQGPEERNPGLLQERPRRAGLGLAFTWLLLQAWSRAPSSASRPGLPQHWPSSSTTHCPPWEG